MSNILRNKVDWKLHNKTKKYQGHFSVTQYELSHTTFQGEVTAVLKRELVVREDAVALVPYDPETDQVVLIEQFRVGAIRERRPWLIEIVAGLLEQGESPEQVAIREAEEEIGCVATSLQRIGGFYPSPGGFSEWVHLYIGKVSVANVREYGGLEHEGEDIKIHIVDASDIALMLSTGEVRSAIAIIGLQWFVANRENIRQQWLQSSS